MGDLKGAASSGVTSSTSPVSPVNPLSPDGTAESTVSTCFATADPQEVLQRVFGYGAFRGPQESIVRHVLAGGSGLVLMPTGGGKSLCYQVPALCRPGLAVVISPLIALMQDQVEALQQLGVAAAALHSGLEADQASAVWRQLGAGQLKLLYVSPERIETDLFLEFLPALKPCLIAIDEAHCISQWGYDFRPTYLEIATIRELFPSVPVLALTATATSIVIADIQEKLAMKKANVFRLSFERRNLSYVVLYEKNKEQRLLKIFIITQF